MVLETSIDKPRRTVVASVIAVLIVLPASVVAYGFRWVAEGLTLRFFGEGTIQHLLPNLIFGIATGMIAVGITHFIFRRAKLVTVAASVSIVWAVIYAVGLGLGVYLRGIEPGILQAVAILIGIVAGSFTTAMDNGSTS